jgi:hypothetical protein
MTDEQAKGIIRRFEIRVKVYSEDIADVENSDADLRNYWRGCLNENAKAIEIIKEVMNERN